MFSFFKNSESEKATHRKAATTPQKTRLDHTDQITFSLPKLDAAAMWQMNNNVKKFFQSPTLRISEVYRIYDTNYYILTGYLMESSNLLYVVLYKKEGEKAAYVPVLDPDKRGKYDLINDLKRMGLRSSAYTLFKEYYQKEETEYLVKCRYSNVNAYVRNTYSTMEELMTKIKADQAMARCYVNLRIPITDISDRKLGFLLEYNTTPEIIAERLMGTSTSFYLLSYKYKIRPETMVAYQKEFNDDHCYEMCNKSRYALLHKNHKDGEVYYLPILNDTEMEERFKYSLDMQEEVPLRSLFDKDTTLKLGKTYHSVEEAANNESSELSLNLPGDKTRAIQKKYSHRA